jgi:hypothetical protein
MMMMMPMMIIIIIIITITAADTLREDYRHVEGGFVRPMTRRAMLA